MTLQGIGASSGIALGKALVLNLEESKIEKVNVDDSSAEVLRLKAAIEEAKNQLSEIMAITNEKLGADKAQIFEGHLLMLEDEFFIKPIEEMIANESVNAEWAMKTSCDTLAETFAQMESDYMKERVADLNDISKRVVDILLGKNTKMDLASDDLCILVARDLTPSDTAQLDKNKVLAFITEIGGKTSHAAIMARSLELPAIVGIQNVMTSVQNGDFLIIDGSTGKVLVNPDQDVIESYNKKLTEEKQAKELLMKYRDLESISLDGKKVEVVCNIGSVDDIEGGLKNGAEGVGLFRTEFLYMGKDDMPSEEEQFTAYKAAVEKMNGNPVIIRTLDIGGDKKLSYLPIPEEMNPFLGYRAIRLCLDRQDIFKIQLRALLRASAFGNLKIMFPMISGLAELKAAKKVLNDVKAELKEENINFSDNIEIGIMIEIPSAALISDILAKEVDFFSIGTNDLIQYTIAVDRMNEKVSYLYDFFNPSVLRLIKLVIDNAHKNGKWVGMCGEMAGNEKLVPVLLGFGLDEFSMSASSILNARKVIRNTNYEDAKVLAEKVLACGLPEEISKLL